MTQEPSHPLLSLPDDQIVQKLREMSLVSLGEILRFSLISERCKDLVKSIQIKVIPHRVDICERIYIHIVTDLKSMIIDFYEEPEMYWGMGAHGRKKKLTVPQTVNVIECGETISDDITSTWENNTLTMQYWLKHLQDIFNYPKIGYIWFTTDSSQFDIDDIKEVFGTATQVWISHTGCYAFNQMVLQNFLSVDKVIIKHASFENTKIPGKILMQNFDYLDIDSEREGPTSMTLDELLLINSKKSYIGFLRISAKQMNKFIKLWQRGSNPRMEYLAIAYTNVNEGDKEVIMKGISHQVIPADQRRRFKPAECGIPEVIEGGIDIFRKDGVKATIRFKDDDFPAVEMIVWFDHCVGES